MMSFLIIILLIIILLSFKFKIYIFFKVDNFDTFIQVKIGFLDIKRKGALVKRENRFKIEKNKSSKKKPKLDLKEIPKYIEVKNLNMNFIIGTPFIFFTIFSIPILATILEFVKTIQFKSLQNYSYSIAPYYNDFKLFMEVESIFKINVISIILYILKVNKNSRKAI